MSRAEAPEEPVQGGEDHESPSVGLQAPLVVPLPDDPAAGEEEAGVESTGLACTTAAADGVEETAGDVMDGEGVCEGTVVGVTVTAWF